MFKTSHFSIYTLGYTETTSSGSGTVAPEEENPKTFDGISNSILMGTISLIGLVGISMYLKKRNKIRAN